MATDFSTLRRKIVEQIEADLAQEAELAQRMRDEVIPLLAAFFAERKTMLKLNRVWLFGSYAWGAPTSQSDVDLLVEGAIDPEQLAREVLGLVDRPVHVLRLDRAPQTLVQRAQSQGLPL